MAMRTGNRQSGGRQARQAKHRTQPAAPAYITRKIGYYDFLDEDALAVIEAQADWLLSEKGIAFRDDLDALALWQESGADIDGDIVRAPAELVRQLISTAPSEFTQIARNPNRSVRIGGNNTVFAPIYGAPFVRDLEGGRRYGSIADFEKLVKLTAQLPTLHHGGFVTCEPCDIPVNKRHLDMLYAHMTLSDKPHLGAITAKDRAEDSVAMARILHGAETFENSCVIMGNVNTNSPLMVDKVVTEAIRTYCGAGQGIIVVPFILSGAMGPVTTAASVAQALAEAMACCAFAQLVRPGAPFILGNFLSSMSLKSGAPTFGMPEPVMSNYAIGQLARRLRLPLRCGGGLTASKLPDAQAAAESADSMHSTALAGANFVLHSAGWLESGLVTSFEKLLIDADRLGAYQVMLSGMAVDENALGRQAFVEIEPAAHYLGSAHTMANYQTAFYEACLSDSESFEQWVDKGEMDMPVRANGLMKDMLAAYTAPPLDPAIDEELRAYIAQRKEVMPDAWY